MKFLQQVLINFTYVAQLSDVIVLFKIKSTNQKMLLTQLSQSCVLNKNMALLDTVSLKQ